MTDVEIVNALKGEIRIVEHIDGFFADCISIELLKNILALIERQKAEIEKMRSDTECLVAQIKDAYMQIDVLSRKLKTAKSEAIKEFLERLKESKIKPEYPWDDYYINEGTIDALAKEMMEENENDR